MKYYLDVPKTPSKGYIEFLPLSDIHIGHEEHKGKHFLNTLRYGAKNKVYWGFGGDGMENVVSLKAGMGNQLCEQRMNPTEQFKALCGHLKKLNPLRCAYLVPGNHENRTLKAASLNVTELVAGQLGLYAKFLPGGAMIRFRVGSQTYNVGIFHGYSAARSNKFLEHERRFSYYPSADILLLGHTHYLGSEPRTVLDVGDDGREHARLVHFVRTGTYLGYALYAREMALPPGSIGTPIIRFYGNKKRIEIDCETLRAAP